MVSVGEMEARLVIGKKRDAVVVDEPWEDEFLSRLDEVEEDATDAVRATGAAAGGGTAWTSRTWLVSLRGATDSVRARLSGLDVEDEASLSDAGGRRGAGREVVALMVLLVALWPPSVVRGTAWRLSLSSSQRAYSSSSLGEHREMDVSCTAPLTDDLGGCPPPFASSPPALLPPRCRTHAGVSLEKSCRR